MKHSDIIPTQLERKFDLHELFFSTTDLKGVITSGNSVFSRVADYPFSELVDEPHNIIRHPDMPGAVFKLLWDYLGAGKTIGAYVKNMARNGDYYWVYTLVSPIPDGYISIRFKPSTPLLGLVGGVYNELRGIEKKHGLRGPQYKAGMEAATARLVEIIGSKGFNSYDDFMRATICLEIKSRDQKLAEMGSKLIPEQIYNPSAICTLEPERIKKIEVLGEIWKRCKTAYQSICLLFVELDRFVELNEDLHQKSGFITNLTGQVTLISLNVAVEAAKLGGSGLSLGVIAHHMRDHSGQIDRVVVTLSDGIDGLSGTIKEIIFNLAATRLQLEMMMVFCQESCENLILNDALRSNEQNWAWMIQQLQGAFFATWEAVQKGLGRLSGGVGLIHSEWEELNRALLALRCVGMSGMIEASRLDSNRNFQLIFKDVKANLDGAASELNALKDVVEAIDVKAKETPRYLEHAQKPIQSNTVAVNSLSRF